MLKTWTREVNRNEIRVELTALECKKNSVEYALEICHGGIHPGRFLVDYICVDNSDANDGCDNTAAR